jgi:Uma2 family endonuclease
MSLSTIKMTTWQFLELGEDPPGVHLELIDGEVVVGPSPIPDHGFVVGALFVLLAQHIKKHDLGQIYMDISTVLGEHDVPRPDILFFAKSRLHLIGEKAMEGAPDLAVEVLSPSSVSMDRKKKFGLYAASKVKNYWIVDPRQRTIEAYRLQRGKYAGRVRGSGSDVIQLAPFSGLKIPLGELWRPKL